MTERTTIVLTPSLRAQLRRRAAEQGVSMSELIREALEEKFAMRRPKPKLGIFTSGYSDTATRAGDIEYEPDPWR